MANDLRVLRYDGSQKGIWDAFVDQSRNGSFVHRRDFIEYHGDRYEDCSLLVFSRIDTPVALLPAHREGDRVSSHSGLTYAGVIIDDRAGQAEVLEIFDALLTWCGQEGVIRIVYKTTPHIHHRIPAEEDLYALHLAGARLIARDVWPVIPRDSRLTFQDRRRRGCSRALRAGLEVRESPDLPTYWNLLESVLAKHSAIPVHTFDEIQKLHTLFPGNIRLFSIFRGDLMLGGVLIFETGRVARAQYIAAVEEALAAGGLDLLFAHLIHEVYADIPYFDFGTTTSEGGGRFHRSLSDQKEGFGARTIVHDRYEIDLGLWKPGNLLRHIQ